MKKQKKKKHSKSRVHRQSRQSRVINMQPENLARYVRLAEEQALPDIQEMELSAGGAIFLLAQYTQALVTGNPQITIESATTIANSVVALWQTGSYIPGPEYPFTLEETLQELKEGIKAKADYSKYFQPFTPSSVNTPVGIGLVAGGIVQHPKTLLWQIWMIIDGPCALLGAYRNPANAQSSLERIVNTARHGDTCPTKYGDAAPSAQYLYHELISQGDDEPVQLPFDMMAYLLEHLHLYTIEL